MDFVFDPSLVLYLPLYQLDGASFVSKDTHGHLCSVTGALWRPNGHYFDGTDDYIDFSSGVSTFASLTEGTVEAWFRVPIVQLHNRVLFSISHSADPSSEWAILLDSVAGKYLKILHREGGSQLTGIDSTDVADNVWHHIVAVVSASGNKWVLDNVELTLAYTAGDATTQKFFAGVLTADTIGLGRNVDSGGGAWFWGGDIGELRIYSRALTPQEIQHNYLATKWRYR